MLASLAIMATLAAPNVQVDVDARLKWFREARLGMFIHWGPVSLRGTEIGWSRGDGVPVDEYDNLYKRFEPVKFDANAWMKLAKEAGMRYVVPTARHHDGFCLWPTKTSDYSIANTPFKRDIMAEIAAAAKQQRIAMCTYYSILDWRDDRYGTGSPGGKGVKPNPRMREFMDSDKAQLAELVANYDVKMIWFDGQWESPYTAAMAADLETFVRGLKPGIILNNRVGKADWDGDYDTPEQRIGSFQRGRAWETCMTLCNQWANKPDDPMKSFDQVVKILVETVTGDGNLLLNVGPTSEGEIEARQATRLRELGAWLKKYGESIYGTRGGPYMNGPWGGATCKGKSVYIHLLDWNGQAMKLPALPAKILRSRSLSDAQIKIQSNGDGLEITGNPGMAVDTVIKLELDRVALSIAPIPVMR